MPPSPEEQGKRESRDEDIRRVPRGKGLVSTLRDAQGIPQDAPVSFGDAFARPLEKGRQDTFDARPWHPEHILKQVDEEKREEELHPEIVRTHSLTSRILLPERMDEKERPYAIEESFEVIGAKF